MDGDNDRSKATSLILSSDAKPRLKWNAELHQRFIDAVKQLGGADKATPKSLMRVMGIRGLTLYHLKSHLQKYRLGKNQLSKPQSQSKQECRQRGQEQRSHFISDGAKEQINEYFIRSLQITRALQMQMEVQRKLHQQIEVQKHLQLRIEAQGKYLQSVLIKAHETLSRYSSCAIEAEHAKAQLSELVSMVDSGGPCSSLSELTQSDGSMLLGHNMCTHESSLTSSESSWRNEEAQQKYEDEEEGKEKRKSIDLNLKLWNDFDSGRKMIDLNSNGVEF